MINAIGCHARMVHGKYQCTYGISDAKLLFTGMIIMACILAGLALTTFIQRRWK